MKKPTSQNLKILKAPSRAQEKAPAEPEAPRPSLASEEPGNAPKCEKSAKIGIKIAKNRIFEKVSKK